MRLVTVLALVAGLLGLPAARAGEPLVSYCPATTLSGFSWSEPDGISTVQRTHTYDLSLWMACVGGGAEGSYGITLEGVATGVPPLTGETCAEGHSTGGSVSGASTLGVVSGGFSFDRVGVHYVITGTLTAGTKTFVLLMWLDVVALLGCPAADVRGGAITGHGALVADAGGQACTLLYGPSQTAPEQYIGLAAAAWTAPGATSVSIMCTVVLGGPGGVVVSAASAEATGSVGALTDLVAFAVPPGEPVFICSDIGWTGGVLGDGRYERCDLGTTVAVTGP